MTRPFGAHQSPSEGRPTAVEIQQSRGTCWPAQKHAAINPSRQSGEPIQELTRISPSYHLFYSVDNSPTLSRRRKAEYSPFCALCLQYTSQAVLSHDDPCCCQTCSRINHLPVNVGWKFLAITAGAAFQWDACPASQMTSVVKDGAV